MTDGVTVKPRTRCTWTAGERAAWLNLFERSGKTLAEFCRDNGLAAATLSFWRTHSQGKAAAGDAAAELIEVPRTSVSEIAAPTPIADPVILQLHGGMRLQIPPGTDPAWLAEIVRACAPERR